MSHGWLGVDLDGTLAEYYGWRPDGGIGAPVPLMLERVKRWLKEGKDVRIVTARVNPAGRKDFPEQFAIQRKLIAAWCLQHIGKELPVGYEKDLKMIELWDDRAVQVEPNTGRRVDGKTDL